MTGRTEIDVDEARARIEAEPEEAHCAIHVLRPRRAANGVVVFGTAIARADNQRFAQPVLQRLRLVQCKLVDQEFTGAATGDFGRREVEPAPAALGHIAPVVMVSSRNEEIRLEGGFDWSGGLFSC